MATIYNSDRNIIFNKPEYNDKFIITKSTDTFFNQRSTFIKSFYFLKNNRYIIHNFYPKNVAEYRIIYQKSPHEFISIRKFTFGLHIPPNDIKKVILKVAPKIISDRYLVSSQSYIPYNDRYIIFMLERRPLLRIVKNPDYFSWRELPLYINEYTFTIKKHFNEIDWNSISLIFEIGDEIKIFNIHNSKVYIEKLRDDIYRIMFKDLDLNLPINTDNIRIKISVIDIEGNYLSEILY